MHQKISTTPTNNNDVTDKDIKIKYTDDPKPIYEAMGNKYQVIFDRMFDRRFDNTKFLQAVDKCEFVEPEIALERCFHEFLEKPIFRETSSFAIMDKIVKEEVKLTEISGVKQKCKYLTVRYLPKSAIKCIKAVFK